MRRWIFYLSAALSAFALGSIIAAEFRQQSLPIIRQSNQPNLFPLKQSDFRTDLKRNTLSNPPEIQLAVKKKAYFTCNDKILSAVLKDLRKEKWFNDNARNYLEITEYADCHDILSIKQSVDLNGDGNNEFVVRGKDSLLCGVTGNCSMWIYEKSANSYKKLLEVGGEFLIIRRATTNSYKDIFIRDHESASESYQSTYKFSKGKYREGKCLFVDDSFAGNKIIITCAEKSAQFEKEYGKIKLVK